MTTALVYQKVPVRDRDEMVCLTDMWRAAGGDRAKRAVNWIRSLATVEFIEHVATTLNVASCDIYATEAGRYGGTWAHWQVAMAYAKYLSPEFHAWCNEVVRARYERREPPAPTAVTMAAK